MNKVNCLKCNKILWRSPSKVEPRNFCSLKCYSFIRNKELEKAGKKTRITPKLAKKFRKKCIQALKKKTKGVNHYAWKGEKVSYYGLHMWINREKGKAKNHKCSCGKKAADWASIDGKYPRILEHYIPMCKSCHKLKDLAIQATLNSDFAIQ